MVLCKNCGQNVPTGEPICPECGNPLSENAYDLDSAKPLQGSYIMPGSPGYVPTDGIKVMMQKEEPATDLAKEANEQIDNQKEIIKDDLQEEIKEDLVTKDLEEEKVEMPVETSVEDKPVEAAVFEDIKADEPPVEKVETEIPNKESMNNSQRASDSGSYSPPKQSFNANIPPAPPTSSGGSSGRKIPKAAIAIGAVVLILAIFFLTRGKGNKLSDAEMAYVGKWTSFVGLYDGMYFDSEEDPNIGDYKIDINEDKTFVFDFDQKFEGTWELKDDILEVKFSDGSTEQLGAYKDILELPLGQMKFYFTNGNDSKMKDTLLEALKSQKASLAAVEENKDEPEEPKEEPTEEPKEEPATETPVASSGGEGVDIEYWYGDWEGYLLIEDAWGAHADLKDTFTDIDGVIAIDDTEYLEYIETFFPEETDPFLSMYIEITESKIEPIIEEGAEDAFIYNRYLYPEDAEYFVTLNNSASPTIRYEYEFIDPIDNDDGLYMIIVLKKVGESWENEDIIPPKYQN